MYTHHTFELSSLLQVALLFLSNGDLPHERAWAAWLGAARRLVPLSHVPAGDCERNQSLRQEYKHVRDWHICKIIM